MVQVDVDAENAGGHNQNWREGHVPVDDAVDLGLLEKAESLSLALVLRVQRVMDRLPREE